MLLKRHGDPRRREPRFDALVERQSRVARLPVVIERDSRPVGLDARPNGPLSLEAPAPVHWRPVRLVHAAHRQIERLLIRSRGKHRDRGAMGQTRGT